MAFSVWIQGVKFPNMISNFFSVLRIIKKIDKILSFLVICCSWWSYISARTSTTTTTTIAMRKTSRKKPINQFFSLSYQTGSNLEKKNEPKKKRCCFGFNSIFFPVYIIYDMMMMTNELLSIHSALRILVMVIIIPIIQVSFIIHVRFLLLLLLVSGRIVGVIIKNIIMAVW